MNKCKNRRDLFIPKSKQLAKDICEDIKQCLTTLYNHEKYYEVDDCFDELLEIIETWHYET